jgi:hypothetical protein
MRLSERTRMNTYSATVTRDGGWWSIEVPEIGQVTQARRLGDIDLMARELIAVTLDVPLESVVVTATIDRIGAATAVTRRADQIRAEREAAAELDRAASDHAVELATQLANANVPMRDIGAILGVSYQRAHQILAESRSSA